LHRVLGLTKIFTSKEKSKALKTVQTMDFLNGKDWLARNGSKSFTKVLIYGNINAGNITDFFPSSGEI